MVKLKYIMCDKLNLDNINSTNYLCDDMSVKQNEKTYTDIIKEDKIREIESIQQRVVEFQKNAQQSLSEKEAELFIPIREKAMKAIDEVAKEGEFTFIFDSGSGSFLFAAESENIINLVKSKLGL